MAKKITAEALQKKFKAVSNTQDSIPMLSLWIIHHKQHHKLIADQWLEVLKKAKSSHRLTLVYLCNDVIQNCRRKNAPIFKESFSEVLPEAVTHLRDTNIKSSVQRVIKIWSKRGVLESEFTDQLIAALLTNKAPEKLRQKLLVEYKTTSLIDEIKQFKDLEDNIEIDQRRLQSIRVDVSSSDAIRKLKDKVGGEKFSKEFEESATQLQSLLGRFEKYVDKRKNLLEILEKGAVYYHAQYHEAKIVVDAYKDYEGRLVKMNRRLEKIREKFPPSDDMEMSDDDNNEIASTIISVNPMSVEPPTNVDKSADNPTKTIAENILKLLPKQSNKVEDVAKKEVSRPGMRGANKDTKTKEATREVLTIVRSLQDAQKFKKEKLNDLPRVGSESPPSPTGSPELNILSPPRHQSLDSRLADLFSDGVNKENSASDCESENNFSTKPQPKPKDILPGFGDLDKTKVKKKEKVIAHDLSKKDDQKISVHQTVMEGLNSILSNSSQIPVISGSARMTSATDNTATPTQDEVTFSSSQSQFLSPPRFSGDALGFLSNFMGQATKTELTTASQSTTTQKTSAASSSEMYDSWPPPSSTMSMPVKVEKTVNKTASTWDSAVATLPPPPIFSWSDTAVVPPPWQHWSPSVSAAATPVKSSHTTSKDTFEPPEKRGKIESGFLHSSNAGNIKPALLGGQSRRSSNLITLNPLNSPTTHSSRMVYSQDGFTPAPNRNSEQLYSHNDKKHDRQNVVRSKFDHSNGNDFSPQNGQFRDRHYPLSRKSFPDSFEKSFEPRFRSPLPNRVYRGPQPRPRFLRPNLLSSLPKNHPRMSRENIEDEQIEFELKLLEEDRMRDSEIQMRMRPRHCMPPPRGWNRPAFPNPMMRPRLHSPRNLGPPKPRHAMFSPRLRY